jgi:hypothetical protein
MFVFYGVQIKNLPRGMPIILREEHRLRGLWNRFLRKIFGPNRE